MKLIYSTMIENGFVKVFGKLYAIKNNEIVVENGTDAIKLILDKHPGLTLITSK